MITNTLSVVRTGFAALTFALLLSVVAAPASTTEEGEDLPRRDVVWAAKENRIPQWISLPLLLGDVASAGQITDAEVQANREALFTRPIRGGCMPAERYPNPGPPPSQIRLLDALTGGQLSVLGTVEKTEVGWNPFFERVETLVFLRIEEIFVDQRRLFEPGDVITFLDPSGEIRLSHGRLCTEKPAGAYSPKVGDLVAAVGAAQDLKNPDDFVQSCAYCSFAVIEHPETRELVAKPPPVPVFDQSTVALTAVRTRLAQPSP